MNWPRLAVLVRLASEVIFGPAAAYAHEETTHSVKATDPPGPLNLGHGLKLTPARRRQFPEFLGWTWPGNEQLRTSHLALQPRGEQQFRPACGSKAMITAQLEPEPPLAPCGRCVRYFYKRLQEHKP